MSDRQDAAQIASELHNLRRQDGSHSPADVRDWAEANPDSALHQMFTWDKGEAAYEYQLLQARHIIKRYVVYVEDSGGGDIVVPVISVPSLRKDSGGSYIAASTVAANEGYRQEVLDETKRRLHTIMDRHKPLLPELSAVWRAIAKHC